MKKIRTEESPEGKRGMGRDSPHVLEMDVPTYKAWGKLLTAAKRVIANWERGDLAAAVRELDQWVKEIEGKADDINLMKKQLCDEQKGV